MSTITAPPPKVDPDRIRRREREAALEGAKERSRQQPCHLLDKAGQALCGKELMKGVVLVPGVYVDDVLATAGDPAASPCMSGCGRQRCEGCAAVYGATT